MTGKRTHSTDGPMCPHCGFIFTPDDSIYYDEANYTQDECPDCEKNFTVEVHISTSWACEPIEAAALPLNTKPEAASDRREAAVYSAQD